jgi:hypothetical protein
VQDVEVAMQELLLTVGEGVVVIPHPGIDVEVVPHEIPISLSTFLVVVHKVSVVMQEFVVIPHPGIEEDEVAHEIPISLSTFLVVVHEVSVAMHELLLIVGVGVLVVKIHPLWVVVEFEHTC